MTRLLLRLHVIAVLIVSGAAPARACKEPKDEWLFQHASTVFVARVLRTEETWGIPPIVDRPEPIVEGTFRLIELLKGQPPKDNKIRISASLPCLTKLEAAMDYLFFLSDDHNFVMPNRGSGSLGKPFEGDIFHEENIRLRLDKLRVLANGSK